MSLRNLAKKYLKKNIQQGENGHNSAEDACAVVSLVKLKFEKGFSFGNEILEFESVFSLAERSGFKSTLIGEEKAAKLV